MGNHYGQGYEGNEGHGCHESHEGHEEEGCQQDRQGQNGQVCGFPWNQGKDPWWLDQVGFGTEQARKDCDQEASCSRQEGYSSLQQGQGVVPLSASVWLLLRSWGYLRPS